MFYELSKVTLINSKNNTNSQNQDLPKRQWQLLMTTQNQNQYQNRLAKGCS